MSKRLTLQDLVDILAENKGITKKDAENFVRELFAVISENIEKKDSVRIKDFGTFKLVKVNSRKSVDVNTGQDIEIPAHYKLGFTPDKSLRDRINAPFAHFETTLLNDGVNFEDTEEFSETLEALANDESEDIVDDVEQDAVKEKIEPTEPSIIENVVIEEVVEDLGSIDAETEIAETVAVDKDEAHELTNEEVDVPIEEEQKEQELSAEVEKEPFVEDLIEGNKAILPKIEEAIVEDDTDDTDEEEYSSHKTLVWILSICVVLLILGGVYVFRNQIFDTKDTDANIVAIENNVDALPSDPIDSNAGVVDSVALANDTITEDLADNSIQALVPLDTIKIEYGDTMRKLGLKYYGNRSFWVYIYQENIDKINDFNNVPIGTPLVIPAAEKYGIDANSEESLAKARELEEGYWTPQN